MAFFLPSQHQPNPGQTPAPIPPAPPIHVPTSARPPRAPGVHGRGRREGQAGSVASLPVLAPPLPAKGRKQQPKPQEPSHDEETSREGGRVSPWRHWGDTGVTPGPSAQAGLCEEGAPATHPPARPCLQRALCSSQASRNPVPPAAGAAGLNWPPAHAGIRFLARCDPAPLRSGCSLLLPTGAGAHPGTHWGHRRGKQGVSPAGKRGGRAACQPPLSLPAVPGSGRPRGESGASPAAPQRLQGLWIRVGIRAGAGSSVSPGQGWGALGGGFASPGVGMVPGAPRHPLAHGAGASSGSLHLKKRVPPRYLHTLRSASPPAALVEYFYLSTRFPVCNPHGLQVPSGRGPSARGTLAASGSSRWVPATPRGAKVLETPGIVPKRPFPAPLCSWGQRREVSQETSGGGTHRVVSSPEPQLAGSWILPQLSWKTPGFRGTAWHCRRLLEEGWSWAGWPRGPVPSRGGKGCRLPPAHRGRGLSRRRTVREFWAPGVLFW